MDSDDQARDFTKRIEIQVAIIEHELKFIKNAIVEHARETNEFRKEIRQLLTELVTKKDFDSHVTNFKWVIGIVFLLSGATLTVIKALHS